MKPFETRWRHSGVRRWWYQRFASETEARTKAYWVDRSMVFEPVELEVRGKIDGEWVTLWSSTDGQSI